MRLSLTGHLRTVCTGPGRQCYHPSLCPPGITPPHYIFDSAPFAQGLVGVLDAAEVACGRRESVPSLLEGCIAASVEAAFDASLAELSANVSAGAPVVATFVCCVPRAMARLCPGIGHSCLCAHCRLPARRNTRSCRWLQLGSAFVSSSSTRAEEDLIMLLAASCAELYKKEATVYAPLLSPVRGCVSVVPLTSWFVSLWRFVLGRQRPRCARPCSRRWALSRRSKLPPWHCLALTQPACHCLVPAGAACSTCDCSAHAARGLRR